MPLALQMRQREFKEIAQGHEAGKMQTWDFNPGGLVLGPRLTPALHHLLSGAGAEESRPASGLQVCFVVLRHT